MAIQIIWTADASEAGRLAGEGYEPVECSFGNHGSVVGQLTMDHHGIHSGSDGVALRAYRDNFGARKDDPRFVVTGAADADACFAIAALCGILPHPSRAAELEKAPPPVKSAGTRDITKLVELVNRVDTAPIGVRLEESEEGVILLLWNQLSSSSQDATAFHAGVDRWRAILGRPLRALLAAAKTEEVVRVTEARKAEVTRISDSVAVVESPAWGFDVWYAEVAPIIVAYVAVNGNVTFGARDVETAEKLLGSAVGCSICRIEYPDSKSGETCPNGCVRQTPAGEVSAVVESWVGLKRIFPRLEPQGWGGREAIGGSPRGVKLTRENAIAAARVIAEAIREPFGGVGCCEESSDSTCRACAYQR